MKVLILGHGYMAKALAAEAARRGWEVCGNVTPCERMSIIAMRELIHEQEQCPLDLSAPDALAKASALGERVAQQLITQGAVAF